MPDHWQERDYKKKLVTRWKHDAMKGEGSTGRECPWQVLDALKVTIEAVSMGETLGAAWAGLMVALEDRRRWFGTEPNLTTLGALDGHRRSSDGARSTMVPVWEASQHGEYV